jgi:hypothetical protein
VCVCVCVRGAAAALPRKFNISDLALATKAAF